MDVRKLATGITLPALTRESFMELFKEKFFYVAVGIGHEIGLELRNGAINGDPHSRANL
jgi:hypothetical protein